jgi:N-acetylmuramoyl-L-alanine amidase
MKKTTTPVDETRSVVPVEDKIQPAVKTYTKEVKPVKETKTVEVVKTQKLAATDKPVTKEEQTAGKKPLQDQSQVNAATTVATGAVTYRVQVYALNREKMLTDEEFEGLEDVQMYVEDGMYKYTTGVFKTHAEAIHYRDLMVQAGFNDAFVVTFTNGKRIYISPAY